MSKPKIFISYKRKHQPSEDFIAQFEKSFSKDFELLRDANMEMGKRWTRELYSWLLNCDAAVVVVSKEANGSEWCRREWAVLAARWNISGIPVLPVFVEDKCFETKILDEIQAGKPLLNNKSVFKKIRSALSAIPEQAYDAKDFLAAHQAWLSWQFNDAPVFEREPYSLSQVYVEPE